MDENKTPALTLDADPTFKHPITFKTPQGDKTITLLFAHMTVEDHDAWWEAARQRSVDFAAAVSAWKKALEKAAEEGNELPPAPKMERTGLDEVMDVVRGWEGVAADFSREAMGRLMSSYHALTARLICNEWSKQLSAGRLEN